MGFEIAWQRTDSRCLDAWRNNDVLTFACQSLTFRYKTFVKIMIFKEMQELIKLKLYMTIIP